MAKVTFFNSAPKPKSDKVIEIEQTDQISDLLAAIEDERKTEGREGSSGSIRVTRLGSSGNILRKPSHR